MTDFVVDASVAVEYLLPTRLGDSVAELIQGSDLFAPEVLDAEVLSALRRFTLHGRIDTSEAEVALGRLVDWPISRMPSRYLVQAAWGHRHNVTAYDALYVALASSLGVPLLTIDGPLSRAPGLGIIVQNVRLS